MGLRPARVAGGAAAAVCTGTAAGATVTGATSFQDFDALRHRLQLVHLMAFSGAFAEAVTSADAGANVTNVTKTLRRVTKPSVIVYFTR
jgi:hypothetical protein